MEIILRACWLLEIYPGFKKLQGGTRPTNAISARLLIGSSGRCLGIPFLKQNGLKMQQAVLKAENCLTILLSSVHAERFAFHFGRSKVAPI